MVDAGLGLDNIVVYQKNKKIAPLSQGRRGKYKLYQNLVSWAPYAVFDIFPIFFL